jgi:hypothetical protein
MAALEEKKTSGLLKLLSFLFLFTSSRPLLHDYENISICNTDNILWMVFWRFYGLILCLETGYPDLGILCFM